MNELKIFNYQQNEIRTVTINNEPWWVAKDVCEVFGETNYRRSIQCLDDDEKGVSQIETPGGKQNMTILNEPGLYSLLFAMQPSKARGVTEEYILEREQSLKQFKRWVTHEVIPSIRKHGMYAKDELLDNPDLLIQVATQLKEEKEKRKLLEAKVELDKPKVVFADSVAVSKTSILVGELAKILKQNGINIGQNRLFEKLRQEGFLIKRKGTDYNMPTQKAMDLELFEIKETSVTHSDGHVTVSKTTKVTGRGQIYFINKYTSGYSVEAK